MSKYFQELTIKDAFMFAAVMSDEEKCQKLLEMALNMKIASKDQYIQSLECSIADIKRSRSW